MRLTESRRRGIGAGVVVIIIVAFVVITGGIFYAATQPPNATGTLASSTQGSSASMSSATTSSFPMANGSSTISSSNSSSTSVVLVKIPSGAGAGPQGAPGYSPDKITVVIGVNNTVTWNNTDTSPDTVTSVSGNGSLNSGNMPTGATYVYTFMTPGTYNYICVYHSWMTGTVVVLPGSSSSSSSTSTASARTSSSGTSLHAVLISMPAGTGAGPSGEPGYAPDKITIVIGVNNSVTWTNNDTVAHTVTSITGNGSLNSPPISPARPTPTRSRHRGPTITIASTTRG